MESAAGRAEWQQQGQRRLPPIDDSRTTIGQQRRLQGARDRFRHVPVQDLLTPYKGRTACVGCTASMASAQHRGVQSTANTTHIGDITNPSTAVVRTWGGLRLFCGLPGAVWAASSSVAGVAVLRLYMCPTAQKKRGLSQNHFPTI